VLIPLGTERGLSKPPLVTGVLLAINIIAFVVVILPGMLSDSGGFESAMAAVKPGTGVWHFVLSKEYFEWYALLTYSFMHAGFLHLIGNMLLLWVFGQTLEERIGSARFALLYLTGAVAAGAAHYLADGSPVVGASGAVAAVTGTFLVLLPRLQIRCLLVFFVIGVFMIPAFWFIGFAIAKDAFHLGIDKGGQVALLAHLGGYGWGIVFGFALVGLKLIPRDRADLLSLFEHARRRQQFRQVGGEFDSNVNRPAPPAWKPGQPRSEPADAGDSTESASGRGPRSLTGIDVAEPPPVDPAIMVMRSQLNTTIDRSDWAAARDLLPQLEKLAGPTSPLVILPRDKQLRLANGLLQAGHAPQAELSYRRFVAAFPRDVETPRATILRGLILKNYLFDLPAARKAVEGLSEAGLDEQLREMLTMLRPG